jgi:hypothetical protein
MKIKTNVRAGAQIAGSTTGGGYGRCGGTVAAY